MRQRVTICLTAYNHENYIGIALDRLAEQTFQNFKIVACDDGSTDKTFQILKEYESGKLAGKLKVLTHPGHENRGIYPTYDLCLKHVDTEFFMGHASDDFLERDALEYLTGIMDKNSQADFAYGPCTSINEDGEVLDTLEGAEDIGSNFPAIKKLIKENSIREPSIIYRKKCKTLMDQRPSYLIYADWYMNVLLFLEAIPLFYTKKVVNYRTHPKNISRSVDETTHKNRISSVFSEILKIKKISDQPEIALFIALSAVGLARGKMPEKQKVKTIKKLLTKITEQKKRLDIIYESWASCGKFENPSAFTFLSHLPLFEKIALFSTQGFCRTLKQILRTKKNGSYRENAERLSLLFWCLVGRIMQPKFKSQQRN